MSSRVQSRCQCRQASTSRLSRRLVLLAFLSGCLTASCTFDRDSNVSEKGYSGTPAGSTNGAGEMSTIGSAGASGSGNAAAGSSETVGADAGNTGIGEGEGGGGGDAGTSGNVAGAAGEAQGGSGGVAGSSGAGVDIQSGGAGAGGVCEAGREVCNGECVNRQIDPHACGTTCLDCDGVTGIGSVCLNGTCSCRVGATPEFCSRVCVDLAVDRQNCGACGNACGTGEVCSGGICQLQCGGTTPQFCNGGCFSGQTSAQACGADCVDCDLETGVSSACKNGKCTCIKAGIPKTCGSVCVDLAVDPKNCGGCGNTCGTGEVCSDATCQLQCGGTTQQLCNGGCVDARTNPHACGTDCLDCDGVTGVGGDCVDGVCVCRTGASPRTCGAACVDLMVDLKNCGSCGSACKSGEVCSDGLCQLQCGGATPQLCNGGCVNSRVNAHACGASCLDCDGVTGDGSICLEGICTCAKGAVPKTCGASCVDLAVDRLNCGSCGNACKTGEVCSDGTCQLQCGGTTPTLCSGGCVNAQNNALACGTTCANCEATTGKGSVCLDGTCTCNLGAIPKTCGATCVDLAVDRLNCGSCGNACKTGEVCSGGICQLQCGGTTPQLCSGGCVNAKSNAQACGPTCASCEASTGKGSVCLDGTCACNVGASSRTCGAACVDIAVDRQNCGACGNACKVGEVCSGGSCQLQCGGATPQLCSGGCVDTQSNARACGTTCANCEVTTGRGSVCVGGACTCNLGAIPKTCGTACVDLAVDRLNCGSCGNACKAGEVCSGGSCQLQCGGTTPQLCNGGCVNAQNNAQTCGTTCANCEATTGRGSVCLNGTCTCSVGASPRTCGTVCVDLAFDRQNCGACGNACKTGEVCSEGTCQIECGGTTPQLCNGGCVNAQSNAQACGTTCANCEATTGKGSVCLNGSCTCNAGASPRTCGTACVDLAVDRLNCGSCGKACRPGEICSGGSCQLQCGGTTPRLCNGGCVNPQDNAHACGFDCIDCDGTTGTGSVCNNGTCACRNGASPISCSGRCMDSATDPLNCGACGKACSGTEYCSKGACVSLAGTPPSVCSGDFLYTFNMQSAFAAPGQPGPTCQLQADGSAKMVFVLPTQEWVACDFATGVDMNLFDADNGAGGALEIEFCTDVALPGPLNLWYGAYPDRKKIELLLSGQVMGAGCRTVYRAPENAICHWSNPAWAGDCTGHECAKCGGKCNMGCDISFASAKLTLIAEQTSQPISQPVTVTLKTVRFLPSSCTCTDESSCSSLPERTHCLTGLFQSAICPAGAQVCGECVPPNNCARLGQNCVIELADRTCAGIIRCQGTQSICAFVDPNCAT